jgi:hypothetical protein
MTVLLKPVMLDFACMIRKLNNILLNTTQQKISSQQAIQNYSRFMLA